MMARYVKGRLPVKKNPFQKDSVERIKKVLEETV